MLNVEGRKAKTLEDAKNFIKKFMHEILDSKDDSGYVKHYALDLYLPMMMDWVLNVPGAKDEEFTSTDILEVLYMEAAWDLCVEGFLRPGPRATNSESPGDSYGKGYSLTQKGKAWMAEASPTHAGSPAPE